jgi:hypothetical protein
VEPVPLSLALTTVLDASVADDRDRAALLAAMAAHPAGSGRRRLRLVPEPEPEPEAAAAEQDPGPAPPV